MIAEPKRKAIIPESKRTPYPTAVSAVAAAAVTVDDDGALTLLPFLGRYPALMLMALIILIPSLILSFYLFYLIFISFFFILIFLLQSFERVVSNGGYEYDVCPYELSVMLCTICN